MKPDGMQQPDPFEVHIDQDSASVVSRRELSRRAILDFDLVPRCVEDGVEYIDRGYHRAVLPMLIAWVPICIVTILTPMLIALGPYSTGIDPVLVLVALIIGFSILAAILLFRWGSRRSRGSRVLLIDAGAETVSITYGDGLSGEDVLAPFEECLVGTHVVFFDGHRGYATAVTVGKQIFLLSIHFRKRPAVAYLDTLPPHLWSRLRRGPAVIVQGSMLPR